MKRYISCTLALCMTGLLASTAAFAQNDANVDQRIQNQENRLNQDLQSGKITKEQYDRLMSRDNRIQQQEQRMRAGDNGNLTPQERERLNHELNQERDRIHRDVRQDRAASGANIDQRIQNQENRLNQDLQSGKITKEQYDKLMSRDNRIQQQEQRMRSDGNLSPQERERLNHELNQERDRIHRDVQRDQQ